MPNELLFVGVGVVVGLVLGWWLASSRAGPGMNRQLAETKVRGARAVETMKQAADVELARRDSELADVRSKLEHELHNVAKMQAEVKHALDQKTRLGAELAAVIDESFREIGQLYEIGSSLEGAVQAVESRLLAATKRLKEMGIEAGAAAAASSPRADAVPDTVNDAVPDVAEPPQPVTRTGAISEAVRPPVPPPHAPLKTGSALPTRRITPGGPGRPNATR